MKKELFFIPVLFIGLVTTNIFGQTTPSNQVTKQTLPASRTTVKKGLVTPVRATATRANRPVVYPRIDTVKNTDFSLKGQYQFLLSRSRSINGYKLVNPNRLSAVWKSVNDTLSKERLELSKSKVKIGEQERTISELQNQIKSNQATVNDANAKVDEIKFMGISFSKGTYNGMVWGIIVVLAIALVIVVVRSAKHILEAKHRSQLYDEITAEFQQYKAKATEKERKLARELQDERNIVEELKSKR